MSTRMKHTNSITPSARPFVTLSLSKHRHKFERK